MLGKCFAGLIGFNWEVPFIPQGCFFRNFSLSLSNTFYGFSNSSTANFFLHFLLPSLLCYFMSSGLRKCKHSWHFVNSAYKINGNSEFLLNTPLTICFLVHGIQLSLNVPVNTISTSRSYHVHQGKWHFLLRSSLLSISVIYSVVLRSQEPVTLKIWLFLGEVSNPSSN